MIVGSPHRCGRKRTLTRMTKGCCEGCRAHPSSVFACTSAPFEISTSATAAHEMFPWMTATSSGESVQPLQAEPRCARARVHGREAHYRARRGNGEAAQTKHRNGLTLQRQCFDGLALLLA